MVRSSSESAVKSSVSVHFQSGLALCNKEANNIITVGILDSADRAVFYCWLNW